MITTEEEAIQSMLELAMYLSKQEDDVNVINIVINIKGESLHMHFEAYTEDSEE